MKFLTQSAKFTALFTLPFISQLSLGSASAGSLATATVSWQTPVERENGEYVSAQEIGGFEVAYRLTNTNVYSAVVVNEPTATQYELLDLPVGEYEFRVAAFDASGLYSDFSEPTIATLVGALDSGGNQTGEGNTGDNSTGGNTNGGTGDTHTGQISATISWDIPVERENGTSLSGNDIGGYEIAYRLTSDDVLTTLIVNDASITEKQIDYLVPGEYEFVIAAFDNAGLYSDFSDPTIVVLGSGTSTGGQNTGSGSGNGEGSHSSTGDTSDSTGNDTAGNGSEGSSSEGGETQETGSTVLLSATVSWQIPSQRMNGTQLGSSDIGGYEIAYRNTQEDVYQSILVMDNQQTEYEVHDLAAGEYEFTIAAFDSEGLYSDFSEPTVITLDGSNHSEQGGDEVASGEGTGNGSENDSGAGSENNAGQSDGLIAAVIRWQVPELREDGSTLLLDDLGGYEIAFRNTQDPVFESIFISDRALTQAELANLVAGEYEFSIAAYDSEGLYSDFSEPRFIVLGDYTGETVGQNYGGGSGADAGAGNGSGEVAQGGSSGSDDANHSSDSEPANSLLSATITWDVPTERENGAELVLSDIGGYEVAYRATNSEVFETVLIANPTQASVELSDLAPGEYEFIIAAYDSEGLYSDFSDPTIVTLGMGEQGAHSGNTADSNNGTGGTNNDQVAEGGSNGTGSSSDGNNTSDGGSIEGGSQGSTLSVATIRWQIPVERENGEQLLLSDIGGYEIAYRPVLSEVYKTVIVQDHTQTEVVLNNLQAGEYEFVVAAFDNDGLYGDFSDPTVATIGM